MLLSRIMAWLKKTRKNVITFLYTLFIPVAIITGFVLFWTATLKIPDFNSFNERKIIQSTKIYDRTGEILLWDIHENIQKVHQRDDLTDVLKELFWFELRASFGYKFPCLAIRKGFWVVKTQKKS